MKKDVKTTRITVDLNAQLYARLEKLEEMTGAPSKADVVRDALRLYEFAVKAAVGGAKFHITMADGTTERMVVFGLPTASEAV